MKLSTQIPLSKQPHNQIDYNSKLVLLGSCFSENIGGKLAYFKFQNTINPFGILFHPLAIETFITNVVNEKNYSTEDVFFHNEQWHSYDAHSKLSAVSKDLVLETLNNQIQKTHSFLKETSHLIITLGTSWVYRYIQSDAIVANCHKVPQKQFLKELLSIDKIVESLQSTIALVKSINPEIAVLFTVSPIRHLKDGFLQNQQSKSHLIAAIHQVIEPRKRLYYFPSYEIMMDELRDYRFYNEDMIHPNTTAINYIWNRFQNVWVAEASKSIMEEINTLQKGIMHKPFAPNSQAHLQFVKQLKANAQDLSKRYKHMVFRGLINSL